MENKKVEILIAWDDHTWETETVEMPAHIVDECDEEGFLNWASQNLYGLTAYRNAVQIAVYNWHAWENEDGPDA